MPKTGIDTLTRFTTAADTPANMATEADMISDGHITDTRRRQIATLAL